MTSDLVTPDLAPLLEGFPGRASVYAHNLDTGEKIAIEADVSKPTASAAKQFLLLTLADGISARVLDPGERIELRASDLVPGSGVLRYCAPGLRPTLHDLAYLMMTISDNVATNLLLEAIGGPATVKRVLDGLGLVGAEINAPITFDDVEVGSWATSTARALGESFAVLAEPSEFGLGADAAHFCLEILRRHQHLERLPRFLPWNEHAVDFGVEVPVTVFGKSGSYPGVCVDAGLFVTRKDRYAAAVMIDELTDWRATSNGAGPELCARVGGALYEAWGKEQERAPRAAGG
jgi:beta-lactamase class A